MTKKLAKTCTKYDKWKAKNNPNFKPWFKPNEIGTLDVNETLTTSANTNEATVGENAVEIDNFVKDD